MRKWTLKDDAFILIATNGDCVIVELRKGFLEVYDQEKSAYYKNEFTFNLYFNTKDRTFNKSMQRRFKGNGEEAWIDINWFINSPEVVMELETVLEDNNVDINIEISESGKLNAAFLIYGSEYDMMLREIDRALDNRDFETLKQLREMVAEIDELQCT